MTDSNKGWKCPVCGIGNAPHVEHCSCKGKKQSDNNLDIEELFDGVKKLFKPILKQMIDKI